MGMEKAIEREMELLIAVVREEDGPDETSDLKDSSSSLDSPSSHSHLNWQQPMRKQNSERGPFYKVPRSWASKMFMTGCVISFPIAITFYITWWFICVVDGFFSPIYSQLGIKIFECVNYNFLDKDCGSSNRQQQCHDRIGLGFITSFTFIFSVGVFMSSWLGASVLSLGEWFIKRMPFVRHIYNASKQISSAISPDQNSQAFKEVVIIRHPRVGEYAFGFITSTVVLQTDSGEEELFCVYIPTNHLYIGDVILINSKDVIQPNITVRKGIEIVVSGGMVMPPILSTSR